jgi:hypothetical protein
MPGYKMMKRRGMDRTSSPQLSGVAASPKLIIVAHFSMRHCQSGLKPQTANQPKCGYVPHKMCSAPLALDFGKFSQGPQPDFKSLA